MPRVVGVPISCPSAAFSFTPLGNTPPTIAHGLYGGRPPLACSWVTNDRLAACFGRPVLLTARCCSTVTRPPTLDDSPPLSATVTLNVRVPAAVGVPVIVQSPFNVRLAGGVPLASAQV